MNYDSLRHIRLQGLQIAVGSPYPRLVGSLRQMSPADKAAP